MQVMAGVPVLIEGIGCLDAFKASQKTLCSVSEQQMAALVGVQGYLDSQHPIELDFSHAEAKLENSQTLKYSNNSVYQVCIEMLQAMWVLYRPCYSCDD